MTLRLYEQHWLNDLLQFLCPDVFQNRIGPFGRYGLLQRLLADVIFFVHDHVKALGYWCSYLNLPFQETHHVWH